jgi:hypothetical protein
MNGGFRLDDQKARPANPDAFAQAPRFFPIMGGCSVVSPANGKLSGASAGRRSLEKARTVGSRTRTSVSTVRSHQGSIAEL